MATTGATMTVNHWIRSRMKFKPSPVFRLLFSSEADGYGFKEPFSYLEQKVDSF